MDNSFELSLLQKQQASIIYYLTSLDFLKEIQLRFNKILEETESVVETALSQERDRIGLQQMHWESCDTVKYWINSGALGAMKNCQNNLAKCVSLRDFGIYKGSGLYQLLQMLSVFSTLWMTPDEEAKFYDDLKALCRFAEPMDFILEKHKINYQYYSNWWKKYSHHFPRLPMFKIRADIACLAGQAPPRTGVYVSKNAKNGGLKLGWSGASHEHLQTMPEAQNFSKFGVRDMACIGEGNTRYSDTKINTPCLQPEQHGILSYNDSAELKKEINISDDAEIFQPTVWYYVEQTEGEFDDDMQ